MHIAVDPLPCGEILRSVFVGMICLKVRRDFEGSDNLRCGEILREYGILKVSQYDHYERDWSLMFTVKTPGEMCIAPRG